MSLMNSSSQSIIIDNYKCFPSLKQPYNAIVRIRWVFCFCCFWGGPQLKHTVLSVYYEKNGLISVLSYSILFTFTRKTVLYLNWVHIFYYLVYNVLKCDFGNMQINQLYHYIWYIYIYMIPDFKDGFHHGKVYGCIYILPHKIVVL